MKKLTPGQIYLADQRGTTGSETLTRWCTLSYGDYNDPTRKPFGPLLTLNDELYAPGKKLSYIATQQLWAVIVPITGRVNWTDDLGQAGAVDVGQVQICYLPAGNIIELCNPYPDERINFIYMEFKADPPGPSTLLTKLYEFDLDDRQNELVDVLSVDQPGSLKALPFKLHIGRFDGRGETLYPVKEGALFFAFIIAGAFELQGRLMHQRDGLALWDLHQADMETLSHNGVILVLEMPK